MCNTKNRHRLVSILLLSALYALQLFTQDNLSLRTPKTGYITGGLGIASGVYLGFSVNSTSNSSIYLTYGVIPPDDLFNVESAIFTLGYNHFKDPEYSSTAFANIGLSYLIARSTNSNKKDDEVLVSPNIGYDYLLGRASCFVKLGLIGIFSTVDKPKTAINVEFGFAQQIW